MSKWFTVMFFMLSILFFIGCKRLLCNDSPNNEEKILLENLKLKFENIDTIYFDECLAGYLHLYVKDDIKEIDTNFLIHLHKELILNKLNVHVWSFNKEKKILFRTFLDNEDLVFRDYQYIEQ